MITTILNIGVDFVIIFFTEIAVPGLFAAIDLLMCVIDFFQPAGWSDQLECVDNRCFKGPDAIVDLMVFHSMPVLLHRFTAIMEATLNSRTGKRFFGVPDPKGKAPYSTLNRTLNPDTGERIDRTQPESATSGSPIYEFSFADSFKELLPTMGADKCGGCFNCKVPEVRLIWLAVASTVSLFSEQNFNQFVGNVTENCMANGSWYRDACGPPGAELLLYPQWRAQNYVSGFAQIDSRIFDSYAATIIDRSKEMGPSTDAYFAQLVQAARNWDAVRDEGDNDGEADTVEHEKAAAFVYHACRNYRHEAEARGLLWDAPNDYHKLSGGSIERLTGQFLFEQYATHSLELHTTVDTTLYPSAGNNWHPLFSWEITLVVIRISEFYAFSCSVCNRLGFVVGIADTGYI